jgi:hypothetical protein
LRGHSSTSVSINSYYEERYSPIENSAAFPCFTDVSTSATTSLRGVTEHQGQEILGLRQLATAKARLEQGKVINLVAPSSNSNDRATRLLGTFNVKRGVSHNDDIVCVDSKTITRLQLGERVLKQCMAIRVNISERRDLKIEYAGIDSRCT